MDLTWTLIAGLAWGQVVSTAPAPLFQYSTATLRSPATPPFPFDPAYAPPSGPAVFPPGSLYWPPPASFTAPVTTPPGIPPPPPAPAPEQPR